MENLKLSCPAFNRANLEFVNSEKTKKEVCCLRNDVIGLLNTSYLHITLNFWSGIHIYKHYEEREGKGTVANLWFLSLFFVKYFNRLEKDLIQTTQVTIKLLKNQYFLTRQRIWRPGIFHKATSECHPETLRRRCLVVPYKVIQSYFEEKRNILSHKGKARTNQTVRILFLNNMRRVRRVLW